MRTTLAAVTSLIAPFLTPLAFAQHFAPSMQSASGREEAIGVFACLGCSFVISMIFLVVHIVICVWMYNDAVNRRMDAPAIWVLVGLFFPILGLIIYLIVRSAKPPQG